MLYYCHIHSFVSIHLLNTHIPLTLHIHKTCSFKVFSILRYLVKSGFKKNSLPKILIFMTLYTQKVQSNDSNAKRQNVIVHYTFSKQKWNGAKLSGYYNSFWIIKRTRNISKFHWWYYNRAWILPVSSGQRNLGYRKMKNSIKITSRY